jgi:hypothetical protein
VFAAVVVVVAAAGKQAHAPSHMPVRWQAPQTGAAANPTSTALNAEAAAAATGPQQASSSTTGTGSADAHPTSSSTWFGVAAASKDGTEMVTISRRRSSSSSSKGVQRWGQHVQPENVRQLRVVYMKPPRQTVSVATACLTLLGVAA